MNKPRVIHCGTGAAGIQALRAVIEHPSLEPAGLLVHGSQYTGMDAGVVAGLHPVGIFASNKCEDILRLDADAVCYRLLLPDLDRICRLLASGKNVVTTAGLIYPEGCERSRLKIAREQRKSAFYATGINPGWVDEILPLTMSVLCGDIRHVHMREYRDCAQYPAPHILSVMGFVRRLEEIGAGASSDMTPIRDFFRQSVATLAQGLGAELNSISESRDFVLGKKSFRIKAGEIPADTVAGQRWRWVGSRNGTALITQETFWITAFDPETGWPRRGDLDNVQWRVTIEGTPSLRCTLEPRYSFVEHAVSTEPGFNPSALATAMAAVNALLPLYSSSGPGWPAPHQARNHTQWSVTIEGELSLRCIFEQASTFLDNAPQAHTDPANDLHHHARDQCHSLRVRGGAWHKNLSGLTADDRPVRLMLMI